MPEVFRYQIGTSSAKVVSPGASNFGFASDSVHVIKLFPMVDLDLAAKAV